MNFDNLIAVLAVAAAVPLILAAVPRVPVPGPVLEIVAGIVLGPAVLGVVKPDQAVRMLSTIGLAFLLFLAGLEIDVRHFRGPRARLAGLALGLSTLPALIIGIVLHAAGVVESPLLVGIILALLVVRGLPAVLYRSALAGIRDVAAAGLLQATSLTFVVATTTIGLQLHAISPAHAAALVAAGLLSVIISPLHFSAVAAILCS
jgi:Kef-type K+ transport system membrane component KefB